MTVLPGQESRVFPGGGEILAANPKILWSFAGITRSYLPVPYILTGIHRFKTRQVGVGLGNRVPDSVLVFDTPQQQCRPRSNGSLTEGLVVNGGVSFVVGSS